MIRNNLKKWINLIKILSSDILEFLRMGVATQRGRKVIKIMFFSGIGA